MQAEMNASYEDYIQNSEMVEPDANLDEYYTPELDETTGEELDPSLVEAG